MQLPGNYPGLYVADIGENVVILEGENSLCYRDCHSNSKFRVAGVGGVWGDYKHKTVRLPFDNENQRNDFIQHLMDEGVPFSVDDRTYPDAPFKANILRESGKVSGEIRTVNIKVSYDITVDYDTI